MAACKVLLTSTLLLASLVTVSTRALPNTTPNVARYQLLQRQTDDTDLDDFSWVKSYSAIGDSYAAGIGAGDRLGGVGDYFCSRTDQSYPNILNKDARLGDPAQRKFTFWACSGALATDVVTKQIPSLPSDQDLITVSAGGNDLGLVDILNHCIFQWWPSALPSCESYLSTAKTKVESAEFAKTLDQLLSDAKKKLSSNGKIYWTGYAKFFGVEDNQCDKVTWSFWFALLRREYLTLGRRTTMNDLVDNINGKIADAVKRAGDQAVFVDYGGYYEQTRGRYCEAGASETNGNRFGLLLYEWDTDDNDYSGGTVKKRQESTPEQSVLMNGTFEAQINDFIEGYLESNDSKAETRMTTLLARPPSAGSSNLATNLTRRSLLDPRQNKFNAEPGQIAAGTRLAVVPDSYGRIFHPRIPGHALIANLVAYSMTAQQAKKRGVTPPVEQPGEGTCAASSLPQKQPDPSCAANTASSVPSKLLGAAGAESPNALLFDLRDMLCNNKCERPRNLPDNVSFKTGTKATGDCEVAIPIQGGIEAYIYRGTPATGAQQQQCWDSTELIINNCVKDGPNGGWVNGPNDYQFYQAGYRAVNDKNGVHREFSDTDGRMQSAQPVGAVSPNGEGITCGTGSGAGAHLADCLSIMDSVMDGGWLLKSDNTTEGVCTDSDFCVQKGGSWDKDGKVQYGDYCEIKASGSCAVVISTKGSNFGGFPGRSCVSPQMVNNFIRLGANKCSGDDSWAAGYKGGESGYPYTVLGMVSNNNPGAVFSP